MEHLKKEPTSLAVTDLQLFIAFYMRMGIDLTEYMMETDNNGHLVDYTGKGTVSSVATISPDVSIYAQFDADGRAVKYELSKPFLSNEKT